MTSGGETPGIGGVPGLAKPSQRAPRAWANMVHALHTDLSRSLSRTTHTRAAMRRLSSRRRRIK